MASIAQAVTTSVSGAANQSGVDPAAVVPATVPVSVSEGALNRAQDTVNLTETGGRNVVVATQISKATAAPAFQVAYFPPSNAPRSKLAGSQGGAAPATAAVPAQTNNPTTQVANATAEAAASNSGNPPGSTVASSQGSLLSAASQAKLQQLDQVLQQLGINPTQISFAERIALLPLVNDPAAIQQYVQGLPTQTAVLNPATSQVLAPSLVNQQDLSGTAQTVASAVAGVASSSTSNAQIAVPVAEASNAGTSASTQSASFSAAVTSAARTAESNGQKVNISV